MASTVTIDDAGRLVIPQAIRRRLHLHPGRRLRLTELADQLVLEVEPAEVEFKEAAGLLVATGSLEGQMLDHRELRSERLDRFAPEPAKRR